METMGELMGRNQAILAALARPETATWVYFIRAGDRGPIKIGVATNPYARLEELQTGNPYRLKLIAAFSGGYAEESRLHQQFERERLESEWFKPSKRIVALAATCPAPTREEAEQTGRVQWRAMTRHNMALAEVVSAARSEKNNLKPCLCRKERWEMVYGPQLQGKANQTADSFDLARDAVMAVLPPCRPRCTC